MDRYYEEAETPSKAFVGDDLPTLMRAQAPRAGQEDFMAIEKIESRQENTMRVWELREKIAEIQALVSTGATLAGQSGSPIVDMKGRAVAVVSIGSEQLDLSSGRRTNMDAGPQPILTNSLPLANRGNAEWGTAREAFLNAEVGSQPPAAE